MNGTKGLTKEVMLLYLAPSPYEDSVGSALLRLAAGLTRSRNLTWLGFGFPRYQNYEK